MTVLSRGSVVVTSDLWFNQPIGLKEAETQLKAGLQAAGSTDLVIDADRILITGETPELARHRKRSQVVFNVNVNFCRHCCVLGFQALGQTACDLIYLLFILYFIAFVVLFHRTVNWGECKAIASGSFTEML